MSGEALPAIIAASIVARQVSIQRMIGCIAVVDPENFEKIVSSANDSAIVCHAYHGWPFEAHRYITSVNGITWFCKTKKPIGFEIDCHQIEARKIAIPY